jgi:hypothetical protein
VAAAAAAAAAEDAEDAERGEDVADAEGVAEEMARLRPRWQAPLRLSPFRVCVLAAADGLWL